MVSDSLLCALQRSGKQFRHFLLWSMVKRITDVTRTPWRSRGVDYYMPTRQWRVEMTSGVFGFISRAQLAYSFHQSTAAQAGLYTMKSDTSKHLSCATFIFFSLPCLKSRSIAWLLRSGISIHTWVNLFHTLLLLFGLNSSQPRSNKKSNAEKKGKQIRLYIKKRKETENGKTPGSKQPVTNSEAKSGIGNHCMSLH